MQRVDHAINNEILGVWFPTHGPVWPDVLMHQRDFSQTG